MVNWLGIWYLKFVVNLQDSSSLHLSFIETMDLLMDPKNYQIGTRNNDLLNELLLDKSNTLPIPLNLMAIIFGTLKLTHLQNYANLGEIELA